MAITASIGVQCMQCLPRFDSHYELSSCSFWVVFRTIRPHWAITEWSFRRADHSSESRSIFCSQSPSYSWYSRLHSAVLNQKCWTIFALKCNTPTHIRRSTSRQRVRRALRPNRECCRRSHRSQGRVRRRSYWLCLPLAFPEEGIPGSVGKCYAKAVMAHKLLGIFLAWLWADLRLSWA